MEDNKRQLGQEKDEIEIDLLEVFLELLDHWRMIVVSTVVVALIAFFYSEFIAVPQYQSTAQLYVLSKSTSITSLADIQSGASLTNDYIVVVSGRPVLEQVIVNLGLEEDYAALAGKVELNNPTDSRILDITVKDPDPERAKTITDEIAEVASEYIAEKMDQDPPTVISRGYADGAPVSPNIWRNTLIGAFLGFLVACGVTTVSYLINDSISDSSDIESKLGLTVLGTLPYEESMDDEIDLKKDKKKTLSSVIRKSA